MTKQDFLKLKQRLEKVLEKLQQEFESAGGNIMSSKFDVLQEKAKEKFLKERKLTVQEYDKLEAEHTATVEPEKLFKLEGAAEIKGDKGDPGKDGYTPLKGVDYFDGDDGYTPIKGVDYFDGKTPKKGVDYFDGEKGEPGKSIKGEPGKDGSPDTAKQIATKLNTLEAAVDVSVIKGLFTTKDIIKELQKGQYLERKNIKGLPLEDQKWHGGFGGVVTDSTLSGTGVANDPLKVVSAGATAFIDLTDVPHSYTGQTGKVPVVNGTETGLIFSTISGTDEKVKIDASDTTAGYLENKIIASTGININKVSVGGNEHLEVVNSAPDQTVAFTNGSYVSMTGTYPNFTISDSGIASNFLKLDQTTPQTVANGKPIFSAGLRGNIYDNQATPKLAIDAGNRSLYNSTGSGLSIDWENKTLHGGGGALVLNWSSMFLQDGGLIESLDWSGRVLYDQLANASMLNWLDSSKGLHILESASAPGSPTEGGEYYDTTLHKFGYWNGSAWVYPTAASSMVYPANSGIPIVSSGASWGTTLGPTRGDIIYANSTPAWASLSLPASPTGKILQATATDVAWSTNPLTIGASASVSGSNTGDQTITLSSDVTGSGTGSITTTIANNAVTYAKFQQVGANMLLGNPTGSTANASEIQLGGALTFWNVGAAWSLSSKVSKQAVKWAGAAIYTVTYNNGTAGVGATLTNAGTQAAFAPDGSTATIGDRVVIWQQADNKQNGIYTVTTVGNGSTNWVLTRATDFDMSITGMIFNGQTVMITNGATLSGIIYIYTGVSSPTLGTNAITFIANSASTVVGGAVNSVANSDGTLTISPTTGSVVASLALGHANTWTGRQTLGGTILTAGTTTAGTAPLYFTSGTSLTAAVAGAMEFTTDDLFFTITTGTARKRLLMADPVGGLTSGRIPYVTTNGRETDTANLTWDNTNSAVTVAAGTLQSAFSHGLVVNAGMLATLNDVFNVKGSVDGNLIVTDVTNDRVGIGVAAPATKLHVAESITTSPRGIMSSQHNTGTDGARFHGRKSRGTAATPTTVATGDMLAKWVASGYDGTNYLEMGTIQMAAEGTVASTRVPTNLSFWTATDAAPSVLTQRMIIDSAGLISITDAGNLAVGTTTGTKIGTATSQKLGFWNATPIIQPAAALQAALTNSTGGSQDGTLVDVTTATLADPAKCNDNFTDIYALLTAIRTALVDAGIMKGSA